MRLRTINRLMQSDRNFAVLCGAAFCMAFGQNAWYVGLPFVVKGIGGADMDVAWCAALWTLVYSAMCVLGVRFLDRLAPRRVLHAGAITVGVLFTANLLLVFTLSRGQANPLAIHILMLNSLLHGLFLSAYWPPLMGWVSLGHHGAALSRRLARFNMSWSSGAVLGPFVGGFLVEYSWRGWVVGVYALVLGALALILLTRAVPRPSAEETAADDAAARSAESVAPDRQRMFLWASRIGLVLSFVFIGVFRMHLPILFKFEFGYTESQYGLAVTFVALTTFASFVVLTRWSSWHYRSWLFLGAQALVAILFVACLVRTPLVAYYGIAILAGVAGAFLYMSHQFYASATAPSRSAAMAAHEGLLGFGFLVGSLGAGALSDHVGRTAPYWAGAALVGVIVAAEIAWRLTRRTRL